jgi:hypothetical protein
MFPAPGEDVASQRCTKCEGDQKNAPVLGLTFIKGMQRMRFVYEGGRILNPRDGAEYRARGSIQVRHRKRSATNDFDGGTIVMSDPEANKATALRLIGVFNGRRLDQLDDVLHPEFRGRGISDLAPDGPEVGPDARRKLDEMFLQAIPAGENLRPVDGVQQSIAPHQFSNTHVW